MRMRALPGPDKVDVSGLNVFVSHRFSESSRATEVANALEAAGFRVTKLDPPSDDKPIDPEVLEQQLFSLLDKCDRLCIVASQSALQSSWVKYEAREAVQLLGRVLYISDGGFLEPRCYMPGPNEPRSLISVKYTSVEWAPGQPNFHRRFALDIMWEHDEGWWDCRTGRPEKQSRDLRRESVMRKCSRKLALWDDRYKGKGIVEVLLFTWEETGCKPRNVTGVLRWMIETRGRLELRDGVLDDSLFVGHTAYCLGDDEEAARYCEDGWVHLLVVTQVDV